MNLGDIVTEVDNIVDDPDYTSDDIKEYVFQAILYAGAQVNLPHLKRIGTIDTVEDQAYVSLATLTGGFSGRLLRVATNGIAIYPNLQMLLDEYVTEDYPDLSEAGSVEAVALEGNILWYQYVPEEVETLTLLYYQNPSIDLANADSPSDFPAHLHRKLFVHGAAWMMFDMMEDGMEAPKVNTAAQFFHSFDERNKHSGITKLREYVGGNRTHWKSSVWSK